MVHLIVGDKGKGKTKVLLDRVNEQVKTAKGHIVYLDQSNRHMYELNNKIRLVNISDYPVITSERLLGFICGIISQDNDIEAMYLDGLLKLSEVEADEIPVVIDKMEKISSEYNIDMTVSLSMKKEDLAEKYQEMIAVAL